jgi:hypothetical protein
VASMLAMAFVMNYSGATGTLGLAFSATGRMFPFFSPIMGWLGVFLTGSDTSSNALFGNLQVVSAGRLGFNPILIAAANSVGGVMGKMISLQTIAVAAAATGMSVSDQHLSGSNRRHRSNALCLCLSRALSRKWEPGSAKFNRRKPETGLALRLRTMISYAQSGHPRCSA